MIEGRCNKCGAQFYGWTLLNPQHQTCERCGGLLELNQEGQRIASGHQPAPVVSPAPPQAMMDFSGTGGEVSAGQVFSIEIRLNPGSPVAGAQMDMTFDPNHFAVNGITEGSLFKQHGANTHFNPGVIDNIAGSITRTAAAIISPGQSVSGPGTFVTVNFTVKKVDAAITSPLKLANVIVGNMEGAAVSVLTQPASITIIPWEDWDVNCDNRVNILDMIIVGQNWGQTGPPHWLRADVNRDGKVDILDLILIGQHWTG